MVSVMLLPLHILNVDSTCSNPSFDEVALTKKKHFTCFPVFFPISAATRLPVFVCPITVYSSAASNEKVAIEHASCVCLYTQNATDSSSNSSQKLDSSLTPLESSPLPQRHKCTPGHRHDLHDSYRLTDHYYLDQVNGFPLFTDE